MLLEVGILNRIFKCKPYLIKPWRQSQVNYRETVGQ